jgi:chromosome segregation ATPase
MTNEEMERAIDFLLKSGARCDARIEQTNEQLAQLSLTVDRLSERVDRLSEKVDLLAEKVDRLSDDFAQLSARQDSHADTQAKIMKMMAGRSDAPSQINALRRASDEATKLLLNRLIKVAERLSESGR